jgi:hypothetical protein
LHDMHTTYYQNALDDILFKGIQICRDRMVRVQTLYDEVNRRTRVPACRDKDKGRLAPLQSLGVDSQRFEQQHVTRESFRS